MRRYSSITMVIVLVLGMAGGILGCASSPPPAAAIDVAAVLEYADPKTENALQGLSEHDIEKYTKDFTEEARTATTQELFDLTVILFT